MRVLAVDRLNGTSSSSSTRPSKSYSVPARSGNFVKIADVDVNADIRVVKWKSERTGLRVVWASSPGPLIQAWTTIVTEVFNDSGIPHTLEHLCFCGSERMPYKGVLDLVGNRSLGDGTNAFTETDNTTFTASTVSEQGMLDLLPVYLDHIFFPTLKHSAFVTEVYHVDAQGKEGGVVFSEMQGREGSADDLMTRRMQESLYDLRNAYRSETGGLLSALRKLHLDEVRSFHDKMYVPQNATILVVGGALQPDKLLQTLNSTIEVDLVKAGLEVPERYRRPLVRSTTAANPPVLDRDVTEVVEYPEADESTGTVTLWWIGPRVHDILTQNALSILGSYLCGSDVAPLMKRFVQCAKPLCSDIGMSLSARDPFLVSLTATSVKTQDLDKIGGAIRDALDDVLRQNLDVDRMATILHQSRIGDLSSLQNDPGGWIQASIALDTLYGRSDGSQLARNLNNSAILDELSHWTAGDWKHLLESWLVQPHALTVIGKPSATLAHQLAQQFEERAKRTRDELGPQGLALKQRDLEKAKRDNAIPVPPAILQRFAIPAADDIVWLKVSTACPSTTHELVRPVGSLQTWLDSTDPATLPFTLQFDAVPSNFVRIDIRMSPSSPLGELLPLYLGSFFSLPITRANGTRLTADDATRQLDKDVLERSIGIAGEGVSLSVKVEASQAHYDNAIGWMHDLLFGSDFASIDRLVNFVQRCIQSFSSTREDGAGISSAAAQLLTWSSASVQTPMNILTLFDNLPKLLKRLQTRPQAVIAELLLLRSTLLKPGNICVSVRGNVKCLSLPVSTWLKHFGEFGIKSAPPTPLMHSFQRLSPWGKTPARKFLLYQSPSGSSSFSNHTARGPSWQDPSHPAVEVALSVLNATQGFLWNAVRGAGLAYGASISASVEARLLTFTVFKSPNAFVAFQTAGRLVADLARGKIPIALEAIESAKSTLVFDIVQGVSTPADAAYASFANQIILGRSKNADREMLRAVQAVKAPDVLAAIRKWVLPIFSASTSLGAACCGSEQHDDLLKGFKSMGYEVETRAL